MKKCISFICSLVIMVAVMPVLTCRVNAETTFDFFTDIDVPNGNYIHFIEGYPITSDCFHVERISDDDYSTVRDFDSKYFDIKIIHYDTGKDVTAEAVAGTLKVDLESDFYIVEATGKGELAGEHYYTTILIHPRNCIQMFEGALNAEGILLPKIQIIINGSTTWQDVQKALDNVQLAAYVNTEGGLTVVKSAASNYVRDNKIMCYRYTDDGHIYEPEYVDQSVSTIELKDHYKYFAIYREKAGFCGECWTQLELSFIDITQPRVYDSNRYGTSIKLADTLLESSGQNKFENIVVACGSNYPDALAGGYLANTKNAPLITVDMNIPSENRVVSYIENNMESDGTVYILGGTGVVTQRFENAVSKCGYKHKRLAGTNRFDTNLEILKAADVNSDILICDAYGYADSLSASAVGRPILLVDQKINQAQLKYLDEQNIENFYLIGGVGAVKSSVEKQIKGTYSGKVERLAGANRYETSLKVAEKFFPSTETVVLTYGLNFPDGLSGGPVALSLKAPLILATSDNISFAKAYYKKSKASKTLTIGGPTLISNRAIERIIG